MVHKAESYRDTKVRDVLTELSLPVKECCLVQEQQLQQANM